METAILILNWNNWQDTIKCIDSISASTYSNFGVYIVDNGSTDKSVLRIEDFARGLNTKCCIIKNKQNYGFAKGVNIGLKYIFKNDSTVKFVWILNNDTIVQKNTLQKLVRVLKEFPEIGIVSPLVRYFDTPNRLQFLGGAKYYPLLGISRLLGRNRCHIASNKKPHRVNTGVDYIPGVALLLRKEVFNEIGYFDEDYFFYGEEQDFQLRAKLQGWNSTQALNSAILHKEKASTKGKRSLYYFYINSSRVIFLRKHFPLLTPFSILPIFLHNLAKTRKPSNLVATVKGLAYGLTKPLKTQKICLKIEAICFSRVKRVEDAVEKITSASGKNLYVCTPNLHNLYLASKLPAFKEALQRSYLCVVDGFPIQKLIKQKYSEAIPRVPGSAITKELIIKLANSEKLLSFVFIGPNKETETKLFEKYPGLNRNFLGGIYSHFSTVPTQKQTKTVYSWLKYLQPKIVFFCIGNPKQEILAYKLHRLAKRDKLFTIGICAGASLEFLAGTQKRAPLILSEMNLEWLYRAITRPKLLLRYILDGVFYLRLLPKYIFRKWKD